MKQTTVFFCRNLPIARRATWNCFFFPVGAIQRDCWLSPCPHLKMDEGGKRHNKQWQNPLNFTQFPKYEPHQHLWINFSHRGWSCFWKFGMWLAGISMAEGLVQAFVLLQRCWFVCSSVLTKNSWIDVGSWTVSKTTSSSWMLLLLVVSCFFLQTWKVS